MSTREQPLEATLESLRSRAHGLTSAEAARRLSEFGGNRIERAARVALALQCVREFTDFFAIVLWLAALLVLPNGLICAGIVLEVVAMLTIAYTPIGNGIFSSAPIGVDAWLFMLPFVAAMAVGEELRKGVVRWRTRTT